jgi:primosomal protein N' (replication factor Y) (superfamily II helicase)
MSAPPLPEPSTLEPLSPEHLSRHRRAPQPWQVALALPIPAHDFLPPHGYQGDAAPLGARVLVPWRGELSVGLVVGESESRGAHRLREAVHMLDDRPYVQPALLEALWGLSRLARTPLGLLVSDLLGVGWEARCGHEVRAVAGSDLSLFGPKVPGSEWTAAAPYPAAVLDAVREQGLLDERFPPAPRTVTGYQSLPEGIVALTRRQQEAWQTLADEGPLPSQVEWAARAGVSVSVAAQVLARGWAQSIQLPAPPPALPEPTVRVHKAAPDSLPEEPVWRLHGGKSAQRHARIAGRVRRLLELGRGVLVIAPDGATLRQAWDDLSGLAQLCGTRAVCFSGGLNQGQREHAWELIGSGKAGLIVGTALALGAPHPDLGLIVLLEEASDAYKLLSGSRAFIPELVLRMAAAGSRTPLALLGCVPAAESLIYPGEVLPPPALRLHVVDYLAPPEQPEMGPLSSPHLKPGDLGYPLSHDLARVLRQVQERGRQAVLLAPRRGYSALLRCGSCQHTPGCPNCDVSLRFHQERRALHCHQCGFETGIPDRCDSCGDPMWQARGPGTEWIVQEVKKLLPGMPVYRHDGDHQDDLGAMQAGEAGVLVGTQGVLSLDAPPNLALIGLTLADTWLNISDFRAGERYHRLLRQLAAWHPTRSPLTVVQTFQADHPALTCLKTQQDAGFYPAIEVSAREGLGYPPHRLLTYIEVAARERDRAARAAQEVADTLHGAGAVEGEVIGPAPSPLARVRGVYPYQLLLRTRNEERLSELLASLDRRFPARVRVDVSPRGMG